MILKKIIEYLEKFDQLTPVPFGFDNPHSYRGDYRCLAFEPKRDTTVGAMLACARSAIDETFSGWKGGEYTMSEYSDVYLAEIGCCGEGLGIVLLSYMITGKPPPPEAE